MALLILPDRRLVEGPGWVVHVALVAAPVAVAVAPPVAQHSVGATAHSD
eukprot:CAMPEP_0173091422 /NCGR_PEP_ID=MMETSP1102-20130122/27970_1 /TAXON_ID=49646 /ORGANISM="Geminigera sp., Strain Caron Lab Isolate" /LENGTH=48 /DNA_ID= /DNA_START= /DNA_END= /DNA_ORIENTATION=